MTAAEHESDLKHTTDIPYFALTGELRSVCCEDIGEKGRVITAAHCITKYKIFISPWMSFLTKIRL